MNKLSIVAAYSKFVPIVVPILLIIVQALIDSGTVQVSATTLGIIDGLLGAVGLHALHIRTK